jgi:hypothetical protein
MTAPSSGLIRRSYAIATKSHWYRYLRRTQQTAFARSLVSTRRTLLDHIERNRYLSFCIGGLIGDWAAFGARLAQSRHLPYSIHTDRVEHEVLFKLSRQQTLLRRMKAEMLGRLMRVYHREIIRGCALGLWHGNDCFV